MRSLIGKWDIDLVLPVPMYAAKQRKRGYNQAELIARELSKNLNLICASEILVRTRKTTPMKELNDEERRKNVERAFLVKENVVKYKKILLVDDIYTTGATIDSCSKNFISKGRTESIFFMFVCGERILRKCRERQKGRIGYGC